MLLAAASVSSLVVWFYLFFLRAAFWRAGPRLADATPGERGLGRPAVAIVVPARNEARTLPATLPALLGQDYRGRLRVYLVDDSSADDTARVAGEIAERAGRSDRLTVVRARPTPRGWSGKPWAVREGLRAARAEDADYVLLTDADIRHGPGSLSALVRHAAAGRFDLVSVMARLEARGFWGKLLIPAFVYFFAKLYPFRRVSDPRGRIAAAAGGCALVRREVLARADLPASIRGEIIDDCALARAVRQRGREGERGRLWLGLGEQVVSVRRYERLRDVWAMVTRSAFAQLRYSSALLAVTVLGMAVAYLVPPLAVLGGSVSLSQGSPPAPAALSLATGMLSWLLMSVSYVPMLRWNGVPGWWAPALPVAAATYTLMTLDSARRRWTGRATTWRGRRLPRAARGGQRVP